MSSAPFDVQRPATEVEIAEAIMVSEPATSDTIRRLAFERDKLQADAARWRAARGLFEIIDTKPFTKTVYWHADFVSDCDSIDEAIDVLITKEKPCIE